MFEPVIIVDNNKKIVDAMTVATPLTVTITNTASVVSQIVSTSNNNVRISMVGITGSGKSTVSQLMVEYLNKNGWYTLIVSADKWSKKGIKGKAMANCAKNEIEAFESNGGNLAIIVDICHDNGINDKCIGYDLSKYKSYTFVPNFEKSTDNFGDYESWCLLNVLSREADTPDSNYWLNPVSAGVKTCIDVHNKKASGIKKVLGVAGTLENYNSSLSMDAIKSIIEPKAASHASKLASRDMMGIVSEFLDKICK
jgi:energy-coupling factor transporter ATP-binding protein EcfA2